MNNRSGPESANSPGRFLFENGHKCRWLRRIRKLNGTQTGQLQDLHHLAEVDFLQVPGSTHLIPIARIVGTISAHHIRAPHAIMLNGTTICNGWTISKG